MAPRHSGKNKRGIARWQQATAVIPLAMLAGAWTAGTGASNTASANSPAQDPGIPAVPTTSFDQRASYTSPPAVDAGTASDSAVDASGLDNLSGESASGIPAVAMAAYRHAESVLEKADPSCHISWELIGAIGRVESDHGRYEGSVVGTDGKARPGIYGVALDGSHGTAIVMDTDNGKYDNDPVYDRAVGPMQFIPGTWGIVGVDADGDGVRDPQDIDDGALAAAVYLCAGEQDLSTTSGRRAAVRSYNHSAAYVDLVLSVMAAYRGGGYTTVADGLPSNQVISAAEPVDRPDKTSGQQPPKPRVAPPAADSPSPAPPAVPPAQPAPPTQPPDSRDHADPRPTPANPPTSSPPPPSPPPSSPPPPSPTPPAPAPPPAVQPVVDALESLAEATQYCASHLPGEPTPEMVEACGEALVGETEERAASLLSGSLAEVLNRLGLEGLLPAPGTPCVPVPGQPC